MATTYSFQFRMARAVADSTHKGALSRRLADPTAALRRVLNPPGHRLILLDPRASLHKAVEVGVRHRANLLLAELVGCAVHHHAAVRVTTANQGRDWAGIMEAEGIDFDVVDP